MGYTIPAAADVVYQYDGSLPGLLCCVHESVYAKELPAAICPPDVPGPGLFEQKTIGTDDEKAFRVQNSIPDKISPRALALVQQCFLSCLKEKEMAILRFLLLGYKEGPKTPLMYGDEDVKRLLDAEKHMNGEIHLLKGFVRFSEYGEVLAATISPKNFVLPFLAVHFIARYSGEDFLIYDKTHKAALVYEKGQKRILPLESIELPEADEREEGYRALWKQFYRTISIESRENPRCRRTNMPKRYWENMTEMKECL